VAAAVQQPVVVDADAPTRSVNALGPHSSQPEDYSWGPNIDLAGEKEILSARPDPSQDLALLECGAAAITSARTFEVCDRAGSWGPWDGILVFPKSLSPINIESFSDWQPTFKADFATEHYLLRRFSLVTIGANRYFSVSLPISPLLNLKDCNSGNCFIELSIPDSSSILCSPQLLFKSRWCDGTLNVGNAINGEKTVAESQAPNFSQVPAQAASAGKASCNFNVRLNDEASDPYFMLLLSLAGLLFLILQRRASKLNE
jgi:hypothetical protein